MSITKIFPQNYSVSWDIVESNVDLLTIPFPNLTGLTVTLLAVNSILSATGGATIRLHTAAGGTGSSIVVTFSNGQRYQSQTGNLSGFSDFLYFRSGVAAGLGGLNLTIHGFYSS